MSGYGYECGAKPPEGELCRCANLAGHTETDHACRCGRIWPVEASTHKRPEEDR